MSNPQRKGVLFDFDGVLINSLTVMRLAFEASYRDVYGPGETCFDTLFGEYRKHLGKGFTAIMRAMNLSPDLLPHFQRHSRALAPYVYAFNGITPMLERFGGDGWVLGIATGKDHARTCELLDRLGLRHHFSVVLGSDSVAQPKPAPDMIEAFCAQTDIPVSRLIMVGDAPADLECARRGHCRSIAALWGFSTREVLQAEQPAAFAESPAELFELCSAISREFSS